MSDQFEKRVNEPTLPEAKVRAKPVRSDLSKTASEAVRTAQDLRKALDREISLAMKLDATRTEIVRLRKAAAGAEERFRRLTASKSGVGTVYDITKEPEEPPMPEEYNGPESEDLEPEDDPEE